MLRSMTAFGRGESESSLGKLSLEISTINRRHLEIFLQLPEPFQDLEIDLRQWINKSDINRGIVKVSVFFEPSHKFPVNLIPDLALVAQLKNACEAIAATSGIKDYSQLLQGIFVNRTDLFQLNTTQEQKKERLNMLKNALEQAIESLNVMKDREGCLIQHDIQDRLHLIKSCLESIETKKDQAVKNYQNRLKQRIQDFDRTFEDQEERILREVVIYADRVDFTEECVRLNSHLDQFFAIMNSRERTIGKKLDFLVQEMIREANTIAAKSNDATISLHVVDVKAECERIREQLQNVE
ncbi:MAG: YicC family protein [Chlamydiales bacterium]